MKTKRMYTNGEKALYYAERAKEMQKRAVHFAALPADEFSSQDWNGKLQPQLDDKKLEMLITEAVARAFGKVSG